MCSEIDLFPSFLRRMSDNRQIFPVDDKEENVIVSEALDILPEPEPEPEPEPSAVERESENLEDGGDRLKQPEETKNNDDDDDEEEEEEETKKATASHREIDDEDDGFKTPTSSAHRIPAITECPPPPVKPRPAPSKLKRKASPPQNTSAEVESIFRPIENDNSQQHMIKKSRTDDEDVS